MFRAKTLFILGAGASHEVGLPLGDDLKDGIAEKIDIRFEYMHRQISGDSLVLDALRRHARLPSGLYGDPNPYLRKAHQLRDALPQAISIDNLLDAYRDDEQAEICGKLGIVSSILDSERSSRLYLGNLYEKRNLDFGNLSNTWYSGFVKILTEGVSKTETKDLFKNLSILSFNYDRCIEHYLYMAIQSYYAIHEKDAAELISTLKILHPYGCVGQLPWQTISNSSVAYGAEDIDLLTSAKQIKTFNERIKTGKGLEDIRKEVEDAEIIVFLGFAFHRQNLDLIEVQNTSVRKIYATAFGISESDCNVVKSDLKHHLNLSDITIELKNNLKCADLFKEYWRSLTAGI